MIVNAIEEHLWHHRTLQDRVVLELHMGQEDIFLLPWNKPQSDQ